MATVAASPRPSARGALAACHAAVALFGFAALFGKWIAWDPPAIVLGRTVVAAIVLAAFVRIRSGALPAPTWPLVPNGIILALHWIAFFAAIQTSTVAIGLLGFASFPLFVPLFERAMLGVALTRGKLAGAALAALGLVLLVPELSWQSRTVHGLAWGVLSGFTFAWLTVRTRRLASHCGPSELALWQNAVAALCVLPVVLWQGAGGPLDVRNVALVVILGVACTALAHTLYASSLARLSAFTAAVCAALEPVYGIVLAMLLQDEIPGPRTLAGAGIIVSAAIVASRRAA
jgi:drug/metabolite transporter (DMT)-like permease